jgi:predicted alpha/beta-hydrolase family hydrolase
VAQTTFEIETPTGPAKAYLHPAGEPRAAMVLGHGAGGGVEAPDLVAATEAAVPEGVTVTLVEQPYRVAGRKSPAPPKRLEEAWTAVLEQLVGGELSGLPLIVGGRSLGARVACRTLGQTGGIAVLCLAFPLQPPARKGKKPPPDRLEELEAVDVPVLVVQGDRDQFGMPPPGPRRQVATVPGANHSLRTDPEAVAEAVRDWLPGVVKGAAAAATR